MDEQGDQPPVERRAAARRFLHLWAVSWRNGSPVRDHVIVTDISTHGFRMRCSGEHRVDDVVFLEFAYGILAEARVVRIDDQIGEFGCSFVEPLADSIFDRIVARSDIHELAAKAGQETLSRRRSYAWTAIPPHK